MLLEGKNAIIHGGGGALGGAAAQAFAREGARVFLAGRGQRKLDAAVRRIAAAGGAAEAAIVDALDESEVAAHAASVASRAGGVDVMLNAVGIMHVQGTPFLELSFEDCMHPVASYARTLFVTAKAVAPHMAKRGSGVILTISTPGSRLADVGHFGFGVACAAIEGMSRLLAGELASNGIRVVCLRSHAIPEAAALGSHSRAVFEPPAARAGMSVEQMLAAAAASVPLKRLPTLDQFGATAAFMASDLAGATTGAIVNLTAGAVVD